MGGGRKNLKQGALEGRFELKEGQSIMRVVSLRGSNIIEVKDQDSRQTLCLLPAKFNKSLWIKKGNYVVVEKSERGKAVEMGSKVTGIISEVLFEEHIRKLRKTPLWPVAFSDDVGQLLSMDRKMVAGICDHDKMKEESSTAELMSSILHNMDETNDDASSGEDESLSPLEINLNRCSVVSSLSESIEEDDADSEDED